MTRPKDLTEEGQLDICESPAPEGFEYLEPCCRARAHKDRCLFWKQEESDDGHGIHTYEIVSHETLDEGFRPAEYNRQAARVKAGLHAKAVYFFDMAGKESTFEEVAALVQVYEWTQR